MEKQVRLGNSLIIRRRNGELEFFVGNINPEADAGELPVMNRLDGDFNLVVGPAVNLCALREDEDLNAVFILVDQEQRLTR